MSHPNATAAGGTSLLVLLVVWLAGHFGVSLSAEDGTIAAGAISAFVLFIGHRGVRGILRLIWRGDS